MAYVRKTYDEYEVWTNYGYGWEVEVTEPTRKEAVETMKAYILNCRELSGIKIVRRRRYRHEQGNTEGK